MANNRMNKKNNNKRQGGSMLDTAAGMVMPQGINAGLAALGLVGLNEYKKSTCRGRKMRGGDANNGMMTNEAKNEVTNMVDDLMKTERNQREAIIEKVKAICAKLPKEENTAAEMTEEANMNMMNKKNNKNNNNNKNKKNNANANANTNTNAMNNMAMSEEVIEENMEGGKRRKNRKQRGGELLGASLDVAFGGDAGLDGLMAHAGVHGSTGAKANLMNLLGQADASGSAAAKFGLEGGKRKNRKQRGGELLGASLDAAFGGKAGLDGLMAHAGVHGSTGAKANLMNLLGQADASAEAAAKLGLEGGKRRKNRKQRGGADMMVSCPDGATPIVSMGAKADVAGSLTAGLGLEGAKAGVAGEAGASGMAQAGPAAVSGTGSVSGGVEAGVVPSNGLEGSLSGQAGAEVGAEAGMTGGKRNRKNRKNGGGVVDSSMELLFPAGLTAGATTFGLLLADEASKRSYVKKAVSSVRKTTKTAAAKAKKLVSRK